MAAPRRAGAGRPARHDAGASATRRYCSRPRAVLGGARPRCRGPRGGRGGAGIILLDDGFQNPTIERISRWSSSMRIWLGNNLVIRPDHCASRWRGARPRRCDRAARDGVEPDAVHAAGCPIFRRVWSVEGARFAGVRSSLLPIGVPTILRQPARSRQIDARHIPLPITTLRDAEITACG